MKLSSSWSTFALTLAALLSLGSVARSASAADTPPLHLYVTIDATRPGDFERMRYAQSDGRELILSTLKELAPVTAKATGFNGDIIVLDENAQPPTGARVLRLSWSDSVSAEYFDGKKPKAKYLGVVSNTPLSEHPYRAAFEKEIVSSSGDLARRDAQLRAATAMNLYMGVKRAMKRMQSEK